MKYLRIENGSFGFVIEGINKIVETEINKLKAQQIVTGIEKGL